jgi:crotonobetainyl-CoA:carnitine CoA-transferase CaiB-like acyl-CoA transferase
MQMWHGVLNVIGRSDLIGDERYEDQRERNHHWDEVFELVSSWTREHDKREVMCLMSKAGVPCGAVLDSADLFSDEHLRAREMVVDLHHPDRGSIPYPGCPIKLGGSPQVRIEAAPRLGAHNEEVLSELGLSEAEVQELRRDGVI